MEIFTNIWVFPKIGGFPQNGWFINAYNGKPYKKWMIWGVITPIFGLASISSNFPKIQFTINS